ncbi:OapC/ArvC family zinc-ribbon domain-containing protein [Haloplanus pelagicus]|jgi:predicted  nucleic acid-binding Zn-ribbon protein|uniref:OapC/ArvC family zinc-ribbon domain-containing protein n=1 Tax=Haloplanus pelagicus TaxID=2949995 RepID=UPI00203E908F|nr:Zn-ribbon containing protein [Haloplanus sp. HW8-1]
MPHQCTNCERVFPDGSKEMLSGCPDCGGNKFQFKPDSATETPTLGDDSPTAPSGSPPDAGAAETVGPSSTSPDAPSATGGDPTPESDPDPDADTSSSPPVSEDVAGSASETDGTFIEADSDPSVLEEDTAQADARRDVVTADELDDASSSPPPSAADAARTVPPDADESPGIDDLRAELNDQFESIKILEPGQYELNLMELYDRQECIISLQEDGHYVIEVADTWRDDDP